MRFTNCFGDLYLWYEGRFLDFDPPTSAPSPQFTPGQFWASKLLWGLIIGYCIVFYGNGIVFNLLLSRMLAFLIAALISAGYYSAPIFFYFVELFSLYHFLPLFRHFAWNLFDFSRLVSLFSHSAKSEFEHQLLSKAIQNEQSQYKKLKSEIETG